MTDPIARIEQALSQLGSEHVPPEGWEARVLAATQKRKPRARWLWSVPPVVVLALIVVWLIVPRGDDQPAPRRLDITLADGADAGAGRAMSAAPDAEGAVTVHGHPGQRLHAEASGGRGFRSIWIYRDASLVMACPGGASCQVSADKVVAELTLQAGAYEILELVSRLPLPLPMGALDRDLGRALEAGAVDKQKQIIVD
jgi:hypothetical protein